MSAPIKIVILGSGSSYPTPDRYHPGLVITYEGTSLLFDCGEAAQIRLQQAGISPLKIDSLFITHLHGDHFFGLPGIIYSMALQGRQKPLRVYGPNGIKDLERFVHLGYHQLTFSVQFLEAGPGTVLEAKNWTVEAIEADHGLPALAYRFKEKDKHKVLKSKIKGVRTGDWLQKVIEGQTVEVGGKRFGPEILKTIPGRTIVYSGDTRPTPGLAAFSKGADLLIHEATYADDMKETAKERFHSTARQAAETAKKAGVKKLLLYHYSRRYKDTKEMLKQAKDVFPKTVAGKDLLKLTV